MSVSLSVLFSEPLNSEGGWGAVTNVVPEFRSCDVLSGNFNAQHREGQSN